MIALATTVLIASATLPIRVEGEGYLRFAREGRIVYAKEATLSSVNGVLCGPEKAALVPSITAPASLSDLSIDVDGTISAASDRGTQTLGRVILARFDAGEALEASGPFQLARSRPKLGYAGSEGFGSIVSAQTSGVRVVAEPSPIAAQDPKPAVPPKDGADLKRTGAIHVQLATRIETDSARVVLCEVGVVEGAGSEALQSIDFGPTPPIGTPMRLTRQRVEAHLKRVLGSAPFQLEMPEFVEVWRGGQHITQDQFVRAATSHAESILGNPGAWSSSETAPGLIVPNGTLELKVENFRVVGEGATAIVAVLVDGRRINSRTISLACAQPLIEGVKAGAMIKVRFTVSGITAEVEGRAKTAGYVGQTVEVQVSPAGGAPTTHAGVVIAPGKVEVKL